MEDKKLIGQLTKEELDVLKSKHEKDGVFEYETEDGKVCYLKGLNRHEYSLALAKMRDNSPAVFYEVVVSKLWLAGCDEIKNIDGYYYGLCEKIEELMDKKKGSLRRL